MRTLAAAAALLLLAAGPDVGRGFTVERIATVDGARELAAASNGDLFVGTTGNDVYVIPHADASGAAGAPRVFAHFDDSPAAGVAVAGGYVYVGTQFAVWRIPYTVGDVRPRGAPQKLASLRTSGLARDHVTTTVAAWRGTIYASVGSTCNACRDVDPTRATIGRVGNGTYSIIARNIRNAIALTVNENTGSLWAGVAGQDELPAGHPYEIFDDVSAHSPVVNYGWPDCYENHKGNNCGGVTIPRVVFPAYATPIGAVFYPEHPGGRYPFPMRYRGGAFVTLHGSWHGPPYVAPQVVFVPMHGDAPAKQVDWNDPNTQWSVFASGYQTGTSSSERNGRPTGITVGPQSDLFLADDATGGIYRIRPR